MKDRRQFPRYDIKLEVFCTARQRTMTAQTRDISTGGVFLCTTSPEPIGTLLLIALRLPGDREVRLAGRVVHHLKALGMGIQFLVYEGDGEKALQSYIESLAAGAPPPALPITPPAPDQITTGPLGRRVFQRVSLRTAVGFQSENNFYTGLADNVSEGGLFVATADVKPLGTPVALRFRLAVDAGPAIVVNGEVRWVREVRLGPDSPAGMGIRFLDLKDADRRRIEDFAKARAALLYEE